MCHQEGRLDPLSVLCRADLLEDGPHGWIPFIAVFDPPQVFPIFTRVFEERDEIGDADDIHTGLQTLAMSDQRRQHHVTAIGGPHHRDAIRIEIGLPLDPIEQCPDILDAVFSLVCVVEQQIRFAIPRRTAHIRANHRQPQLVQIELVRSRKERAILPLGTTVDDDQHGGPVLFGRQLGFENVGRDLTIVKCGEFDLRWRNERLGIQPVGLAECPSCQLPVHDIHRKGIRRAVGLRQRESQLVTGRCEFESLNNAGGDVQFLQLARLQQEQPTRPVRVGGECHAAGSRIDFDVIDVPRDVVRQPFIIEAWQTDTGQLQEFTLSIRCQVDRLAIGGKRP